MDEQHYRWAMVAFGIGASIAAFVAGSLDKTMIRRVFLITSAVILAITITVTNFVSFPVTMCYRGSLAWAKSG